MAEVKEHLRATEDIRKSTEYLCETADNDVSKGQYLNIEMVSNGLVNDDREVV